jgi:hypothetical protein
VYKRMHGSIGKSDETATIGLFDFVTWEKMNLRLLLLAYVCKSYTEYRPAHLQSVLDFLSGVRGVKCMLDRCIIATKSQPM